MRKELNLRLLSNVVIVYMLVAFTWWSVLLFTKNRDAYNAKVELLRLVHAAEGRSIDNDTFHASSSYIQLSSQFKRHQWMIFGEAAVFVVSLVIGIWLVNRGYHNLMRASRQQRDFLLSITHELKSPLAAIRLAFETMNKRSLSASQITEISDRGITDTNRLQSMVNNLLLAAKVEASFEPDYQQVNLQSLLAFNLEQFKSSHNGPVQFTLDIADGIQDIPGDPAGLQSIFNNLIENGIKYSDTPAKLDVKVSHHSDAFVRIEICDEGIGISRDFREEVFKKFYRIQTEDSMKRSGTGLGLFIVKEMVRAHGGEISLSENSPRGSKFTVLLPKHSKDTVE